MAKDHRIVNANGQRLPFTCENSGYRTNLEKGVPHGSMSQNRGSVFPAPLVDHGGWSLWLEHVEDTRDATEVYWLMWYDHRDGRPTIPLSGVFSRAELANMISQLAAFLP